MFSSPNRWVNYAFIVISGLGFFTNFKDITETFNVSDNLFNILAKDAMITTTLNGFYSIGSLIMIIDKEAFSTRLACASLVLIGFLPMVTGKI